MLLEVGVVGVTIRGEVTLVLTQGEEDSGLLDSKIIIKILRICSLQALRKENPRLLYVKYVVKIIALL